MTKTTKPEKRRRPPWKYALFVFVLVIVLGLAEALRGDGSRMEEKGEAVGYAAMLAAALTYVIAWLADRSRR